MSEIKSHHFQALLLLLTLVSPSVLAQEPNYTVTDLSPMKQEFENTISEMNFQTLKFVQLWNKTSSECNQVHNSLFGNMKAPCRSVRAALRRGTLLQYTQQCLGTGFNQLSAITQAHEDMLDNTIQQHQWDTIVIELEKSLMSICRFNKFLADYSSFNVLLDNAMIATPVDFDSFGPMDSMAWWNIQKDPANQGGNPNGNYGTLPVILGPQ
jgi:hypothetical protein